MNKNLDNTISDLVTDLLFYGRKEDDELPLGAIERMCADGDTSVLEIADTFKRYLEKGLESDVQSIALRQGIADIQAILNLTDDENMREMLMNHADNIGQLLDGDE